jgi:deoxyribose-phosphate aldolase
VAVGLLVASVPVVRVVRVFAMGHEEMKVASGETHRAKRHDADEIDWFMSITDIQRTTVWAAQQ